MGSSVWLAANTLGYPEGGGHLWAYLNWALGLRSAGCEVVWLEPVDPATPPDQVQQLAASLKGRLHRYGFADRVALCSSTTDPLPSAARAGCIDLEAIDAADLLVNMAYADCAEVFDRFPHKALIDIDPGLLQIWLSEGSFRLPRHDAYFTIGESVGQPGSRVPSAGLPWQYTPPCVALDWWPVCRADEAAPFTTVSHWQTSREWVTFGAESYPNDKRTGFLPFLDLPQRTSQPLELALCLGDNDEETAPLTARGWRVRHAHTVAGTPWDYQRYIQQSRGEFSCAKPSYVRLQNAWLSDRTVCYLASGKPAVVQHTGPSRFLPDESGLFRFRDLDEAIRHLNLAAKDDERHCRAARAWRRSSSMRGRWWDGCWSECCKSRTRSKCLSRENSSVAKACGVTPSCFRSPRVTDWQACVAWSRKHGSRRRMREMKWRSDDKFG